LYNDKSCTCTLQLVVLIVEEFFFRKSIEKLSKIPIYPGKAFAVNFLI